MRALHLPVALLLWFHDARRLHFEHAPRVHRLVARFSVAARISRPRVFAVEGSEPNGFSLGLNPRRASIVLTRAAIERLDDAHLRALIAHEVAHIALRHVRRATLVWALDVIVAALIRRPVHVLHRLALPPGWEAQADRFAAKLLGSPAVLRDAVTAFKERPTPFVGSPMCHSGCVHVDERLRALRRMTVPKRAQRSVEIRLGRARGRSKYFPHVNRRPDNGSSPALT